MAIHNIRWLRKITLPLIKCLGFNFRMNHPWVDNTKVYLHLFTHKGYWYHRANREKASMKLFSDLIRPGDNVIEVGGHIGFITSFFAKCVGPNGRVMVFEPGSNNLPYIRRNISCEIKRELSARIQLIEAAVGETNGIVDFHEDSLTGQNNSVVENFQVLEENKKLSFVASEVKTRSVQLVSLDEFLPKDIKVDFVKIDIEGYEWFALRGARNTVGNFKPKIMVEVQANRKEIFGFFSQQNYVLFNEKLQILDSPESLNGNVFCLHVSKHREVIERMQLDCLDSRQI